MPGPPPKHPSQRRHRKVTSTARTLVATQPILVNPSLPERDDEDADGLPVTWHPAAVEFWDAIWRSPMVPEYTETDLYFLHMLTDLIHAYWCASWAKPKYKTELAAEIRLQCARFGLTPMGRRSLQWTIEQAEAASDAGTRRRSARVDGADPRAGYQIDA